MTTDGNFNANNINTVKMPTVNGAISTTNVPTFVSHLVGIFQDATNIYYLDTDIGYFYVAPISDPMNAVRHSSVQLLNYQFDIFPTLIGDYWYAYSNNTTSTIYKSHKDTPMSWFHAFGEGFSTSQAGPMVYYDGSNIYLLGGHNLISVHTSAISVAAVGTPTTFASTGTNLPAAVINAPIIVVGSNIYLYGGSLSSNSQTTIFTATTADPTTWTTSPDALPRPISSAVAYNDGTNVYLIGGSDSSAAATLDSIYTTSVSTPTGPWTLAGTLPAQITSHRLFTVGNFIYIIGQAIGGGTGIMRASTSDPLTWVQLQPNSRIATAQANTHILIDSTNIYALGGFNSSGAASNVIQSASLSKPLEWSNQATLPVALFGGQLIKTKSYYYIIGGDNISGNYYRAPIATPTVWTLVDATGPTRHGGRAIIADDQVHYMGGDGASNVPTSIILRASVINGEILNWENLSTLPIALSRFALIQAGTYVYIVGGFTTAVVPNTSIYRCQVNNGGFSTWINVGTLTTPSYDAAVAILNNQVYIIGGSTTSSMSTTDDFVYTANMTDLANGNAIFTEEDTAAIGLAGGIATCINDDLYIVGGRTTTNGTTTLLKNTAWSLHNLIAPKVPESTASLPTVGLKTGALGSYSTFQRTGILPWLITKK